VKLFDNIKRKAIDITKREPFNDIDPHQTPEPLRVHKDNECHVTPDWLANQMVEYLIPHSDHIVLEPSAGTGQLVKALMIGGVHSNNIKAVEINLSLVNNLQSNFCNMKISYNDFLDNRVMREVTFDRVIMNPPFKKAIQHVSKAHQLLKPDGILIALVPSTFKHENFYNCEVLLELDNTTFSTTKVTTKVIRIIK